MDFSLTDEQEALRELARKIFADRTGHERMKALEAGGSGRGSGSGNGDWTDWYDAELWTELCRANLPAIALPEELGGAGLGPVEAALVLEELGRHLAPVPLLPTIVLGAMPIAAFGTRAQRERWLAPVGGSDAVLTAALEEPAGFDPALPRTTARRDGAGYRLDGEKTCVPAAKLASAILVPARIVGSADGSADDEPGGVGVFLVEPGAAGVALERQLSTHREPLSHLCLAGVRVGADQVLGAPDDPEAGARIVEWIRERALVGMAFVALGVAEAAMRKTADYVIARKQFGRPIASFQSAQHRIADAYIDVECLRSVALEAAWRLAAGLPAGLHARAAKWWAAVACDRVTHSAQHLHGGTGADVDYPIHRHFLWSQHLLITLGGPRQQLEELGRRVALDYAPEA